MHSEDTANYCSDDHFDRAYFSWVKSLESVPNAVVLARQEKKK